MGRCERHTRRAQATDRDARKNPVERRVPPRGKPKHRPEAAEQVCPGCPPDRDPAQGQATTKERRKKESNPKAATRKTAAKREETDKGGTEKDRCGVGTGPSRSAAAAALREKEDEKGRR